MKRALIVMTLGIVLAGCGQKGGLYMPAEFSENSVSTSQAVHAVETSGEEGVNHK